MLVVGVHKRFVHNSSILQNQYSILTNYITVKMQYAYSYLAFKHRDCACYFKFYRRCFIEATEIR